MSLSSPSHPTAKGIINNDISSTRIQPSEAPSLRQPLHRCSTALSGGRHGDHLGQGLIQKERWSRGLHHRGRRDVGGVGHHLGRGEVHEQRLGAVDHRRDPQHSLGPTGLSSSCPCTSWWHGRREKQNSAAWFSRLNPQAGLHTNRDSASWPDVLTVDVIRGKIAIGSQLQTTSRWNEQHASAGP